MAPQPQESACPARPAREGGRVWGWGPRGTPHPARRPQEFGGVSRRPAPCDAPSPERCAPQLSPRAGGGGGNTTPRTFADSPEPGEGRWEDCVGGFKPLSFSPYLTPLSALTLRGFQGSLRLLHLSPPTRPASAHSKVCPLPQVLRPPVSGSNSTLKAVFLSEELPGPFPDLGLGHSPF